MTERTREDTAWREAVIGERLTVDREFQETVQASDLSHQSWELVMTAVSLEIEGGDDPETARLAPNFEHLDSVLPAIAEIESRRPGSSVSPTGGILSRVRGALGLGSGETSELRGVAEELGVAYARALQRHLEEGSRWEAVVEMAAE